jgi:glycosyltransferase involved in cell wall biosynthesis
VSAPPLRVLLVHNAYQQRGGEDTVVDAEQQMLERHGHVVERYTRHNDEIAKLPRSALAREMVWSSRTVADIQTLAERLRPDVVHVHNTFPLISPSIYPALFRRRVPVVQTLHNFRLLCPQAMLLREGKICEDCVGKVPWRGVLHRCYRGSVAQSAVLASMLQVHRWLGTWTRSITLYIALNAFCRDKFIEGGLPPERLRVKPNSIAVPPGNLPDPAMRRGILFVSRLSEEKGVNTLARALSMRQGRDPVTVVGDGPLRGQLEGLPGVQLLGQQGNAQVLEAMHRAALLVLPSIWYENFPRTLVEAFACGLPVLASRLGALPTLVDEGRTGLLVQPGDPAALAHALDQAMADPGAMATMGRAARAHFMAHWSDDANHRMLTAIYDEAIALVAST